MRPVSVLFIGGIGRSGTTVFELSLATDPRVVSLGEVTHLWERSLLRDELCGCGEAFSACPFWQRVGQEAFGGWDRVDAGRMVELRRRLDRSLRTPQLLLGWGGAAWRREVREYAAHHRAVYRAAQVVSGARLVVDSSKQASMPYLLATDDGIDLRVVHCIRDSRAVAYSWTKVVDRPEARDGGHRQMTRYRPRVLALKWVQHNVVVEGLRLLRVPVRRLRYEDWSGDPVGQVRATLEFAGLAPTDNPRLGQDEVDLGCSHTCSGNPMRFRTGTVQIRRDDAWRRSLPAASRRLVTALTLPFLLAYGYRPRAAARPS